MRVKPTFEELLGTQSSTLQKPNRPALDLVRSAQFNVWNDAAGMGMLEQSGNHASAEAVAHEVRTAAQAEGIPAHELKATLEAAAHKQVAAVQAASSLAQASALQQNAALYDVRQEIGKLHLEHQRRNNLEEAAMQVDPLQNVTHQNTYVNAPQTFVPVNAPVNIDARSETNQVQVMNQAQTFNHLSNQLNVNQTAILNLAQQNNLDFDMTIANLFGPGGGPGGGQIPPPPFPPSLPPLPPPPTQPYPPDLAKPKAKAKAKAKAKPKAKPNSSPVVKTDSGITKQTARNKLKAIDQKQ